MAVLTTRSSWTPSVVMILLVIISFSSFDVLNAKKSPAHSPSHSSAPSPSPAHSPSHSSAPVPVPVSPSVPAPGPGPVTPTVPGPAPGPSGPDCIGILTNAGVDCIDYLTPGNTSSDPGAACCNDTNQLLNITDGGYCLCELLANPDASPLPVSITQAWKLPNRCGIPGSPATLCSFIGVHVTAPPGIAPTASPAPEPSVSPAPTVNPPSPPAAPPPPSGGASATSIGLFTLAFSVASVLSLLSSHMFF